MPYPSMRLMPPQMPSPAPSGVSVVNIDNGFGAGYMASIINHLGVTHP